MCFERDDIQMISINSTDGERYQELKDRHLTIVPWDDSKALQMTDPNESIAKALKRQAKDLNLIGTTVRLEGINEDVNISMQTIKESIASMTKQHADLFDLSKLFTCFRSTVENSILIEVEEYRHKSQYQKSKEILGEYQYIGSFHDETKVYPVKITAEKRKASKDTNVHVTITIGSFEFDKIKEEHSILRVHPSYSDGESSDSGRYSSFDISLPHFVEKFNENQAILIKNMPDQMLDEKQLEIKQKLIHFDREKDKAKQMALCTDMMAEAASRGEEFSIKVVPHNYSEKMKQEMLKSGICFIEFPSNIDGEIYSTIAVQKKDTDLFLKVQEKVFYGEFCSNQIEIDKISNKETNDIDHDL